MSSNTWRWVHDRLAPGVWLQSICGGTDVCSALAGGSPLLPVRAGRMAGYFGTYPGVWREGDWMTIESDLSVVVSGRSDSTLNRLVVGLGSADIYAVVEQTASGSGSQRPSGSSCPHAMSPT
ncbi:hypothetical protein [Streptomyces sp. NPDC001816]|uniref:hypothetical protein n=1 Tax=Streptomyces sp. NPDC001816 TaxID=3364612 RepID=UPI003695CE38